MKDITADAVFQQVFGALKEDPGVMLFTALQWLPETSGLRRVFTSHPEQYPLGAEKTVEISAGWLEAVISRKQPFLAADLAGLKEVFSDAELIQSLGCGAVINIPVLDDGGIVGVLALLDAEGRYTPQSVTTAVRVVAGNSLQLAAAFAADFAAAAPAPNATETSTARKDAVL